MQKYIKNFKCASDFEGQEGEEDNNEELAVIGGRAGRLLIHNSQFIMAGLRYVVERDARPPIPATGSAKRDLYTKPIASRETAQLWVKCR